MAHPARRLFRTRAGPVRASPYPRTPACHGFSIIAKVKEGREDAVRAYGKQIEEAIAASPEVLAPLRLHYLRWVLFDVGSGLHFQYQGIFDTDFDKYTEDAVQLFSATGITTVFTNWRGSRGLEGEPPGIHRVRPGPPGPEFPGVRRVPVRDRRRDQESTAAQGRLLHHARPDAVAAVLEFDEIQHILLTRTPAITGRYEFLTFDTPEGGRAWLSELLDKVASATEAVSTHGRIRPLGHVGVHLDRTAGTRCPARSRWRPSRPRSGKGMAQRGHDPRGHR